MSLEIFEDQIWQMSLGERAAVEGVLTQLKPALAIEIGSMQGASLRRIAHHAHEVHSFDLNPPTLAVPDNVTLHTGDSHELLPRFLGELAQQERNVDFVMVDGDHSAAGVRRDLEDLLNSEATGRTLILIHDTTNEEVRRGLDAVHFDAWPKVRYVELDWVPGQLFSEENLRDELWTGLGLALVDSSQLAYQGGPVYQQRYYPAAHLLAEARDLVVARKRLPPAADGNEDQPGAERDRIRVLEAELGSLRSARAEASVLQAELRAAQQRARALEAEAEHTSRLVEALQTELVTTRHRQAGAQRALENIIGSASWRMTEPIRSAKRRVRGRAR